MRSLRYIPGGVLVVAALAATAWGQRAAPISKARQVLLKQAIDKFTHGTLVADLNRNKKVWASKTPEELRTLRNRRLAYLKESDEMRAKLLAAGEELDRLTDAQREAYLARAQWLSKVVARLSPAQREALKKLTPQERARRLLEPKLSESGPTTRPAASKPAE
jgi:hypothetical protein